MSIIDLAFLEVIFLADRKSYELSLGLRLSPTEPHKLRDVVSLDTDGICSMLLTMCNLYELLFGTRFLVSIRVKLFAQLSVCLFNIRF